MPPTTGLTAPSSPTTSPATGTNAATTTTSAAPPADDVSLRTALEQYINLLGRDSLTAQEVDQADVVDAHGARTVVDLILSDVTELTRARSPLSKNGLPIRVPREPLSGRSHRMPDASRRANRTTRGPSRSFIPDTNSISLNYQLRKIIKNRGHFPNDDAVVKLL